MEADRHGGLEGMSVEIGPILLTEDLYLFGVSSSSSSLELDGDFFL